MSVVPEARKMSGRAGGAQNEPCVDSGVIARFGLADSIAIPAAAVRQARRVISLR